MPRPPPAPRPRRRTPTASASSRRATTIHTVFRVTPVVPGTYTVHYEVAAGLDGKAKAVTDTGDPVEGEFVATITDKPKATAVDEQGRRRPGGLMKSGLPLLGAGSAA